MYSPIIPNANSIIPPISRIHATIVAYPGTSIVKKSFWINTIAKYTNEIREKNNPL